MSSQTIIGYSDIFTVGTPMHEYPNIVGYSDIFSIGAHVYEYPNIAGYSGVFEMNMMGQYFSGYSGWFVLNTIGGLIQGQITDSQTGLPLEGAVVKSLFYSSKPSDQQGHYNLYLPFGYGYLVSAFAQNYEVMAVAGIHVPYSNPVHVLNFQLTSTAGTLAITPIQPDPNPALSTVQQGGNFHRYYKIVNSSTGHSLALIPVTVTANAFSRNYFSDEDGIVDISINSNRIGQGQPGEQADFAITSVNNVALAAPVNFTCAIVNPEYGKYWDSYTFGKLGISFVKVDGKKGSSIEILENNYVNPGTDYCKIARQAEAKAGVEFGVGVELGVECGTVRATSGPRCGAPCATG